MKSCCHVSRVCVTTTKRRSAEQLAVSSVGARNQCGHGSTARTLVPVVVPASLLLYSSTPLCMFRMEIAC